MTWNLQSQLTKPIIVLRNEGEDTIYSRVAYKKTLSMNHAKERAQMPNVDHHDSTTTGFLHKPTKISQIDVKTIGHVVIKREKRI
jgi:hypothetical protein